MQQRDTPALTWRVSSAPTSQASRQAAAGALVFLRGVAPPEIGTRPV